MKQYQVYMIQNEVRSEYISLSENVITRLEDHNMGRSKRTIGTRTIGTVTLFIVKKDYRDQDYRDSHFVYIFLACFLRITILLA